MGPSLVQDAEALHRALESPLEQVDVSLSRKTAELMARILEAQAHGQEVLFSHGLHEVSPTEAALMLGMSRPQVRKLMEQGALPYRKVGTHHRLAVEGIQQFLTHERKRRKTALADFFAAENELGIPA